MYLSNCKTNLDALKQVTSQLESELSLLQSKLDETIPKPKKYIKYPNTNLYNVGNADLGYSVPDLFVFKDYWRNDVEPTLDQLTSRKEDILKTLEKYENDCKPVAEQNQLILEHNKSVREKITNIMRELGVPPTYTTYEYKTSRSTKRTSSTHTAGYVGDLDRLIGYNPSPKINVEAVRRSVEEYFNKKQKEAAEKQRQLELEQKKKTEMHELALLRAKYTPEDAESDKYTILDNILSKDKYLRLAYYLEQNRNDWNDGYDYAETGLNGFTVETDEDGRIVETLQKTISESDYVDGRVFRDSWPTYGDLYGKVEDATLLSDLEKVNKHFN